MAKNLRMTVYTALMAALMAAGAYIVIPVGPVPIVLQNLFIMLAGLLLGPRWGTASVGLYLLAGAFGLPVFAGGSGGLAKFAGPTGGYLVGFLPAVCLIGLISRRHGRRAFWDVLAMVLGTAVIYALGATWLKVWTQLSFEKTLATGVLPFLIGDALKIAAAVPIARALRPVVRG
jgi:biotin transport system substrate-specific component